MKPRFEEIFKTPISQRDKFLSRLLGIFSEEIVHHWCQCTQAPYKNLGRPTLRPLDKKKGYTLDFLLQECTSSERFVAEMKCWLEYEKYSYLRIVGPDQLQGMAKSSPALQEFLRFAQYPKDFKVTISVNSNPVAMQVNGAVLILGAITDGGREALISEYHLADVLSVENMLDDLQAWKPNNWERRVSQLEGWSEELFAYLK